MHVPVAARRAMLAFAGVATLVGGGARPVAAQGGLIHLVAHGAQDVYLTAGSTDRGEEAAINTANVRRDVIVGPTGAIIVDPATGIVIDPHP